MAPVTIRTGAVAWREVSTVDFWTAPVLFTGIAPDIAQLNGATFAAFGQAANERAAQSFTTGAAINVKYVRLLLAKVGGPTDNLFVEIQTDASNLPSGTVVATSGNVAGANVVTGSLWTGFTFTTPVALSASTKYWIVVKRSGAVSGSAYWNLYHSTLSGFTGGKSTYNGSSWSAEDATVDLAFQLVPENENTLLALVTDSVTNGSLRLLKADSFTNPTTFTLQGTPGGVTGGPFPYCVATEKVSGNFFILYFSSTTVVPSRWGNVANPSAVTSSTGVTGASSTRSLRAAIRSDGDLLVFWTSSADTVDLGWSRRELGSWTDAATGILSANSTLDNEVLAAGIDSTDRAWVVYTNTPVQDIEYKTVNSANTVSATAQIEATGPGGSAVPSGARYTLFDDAGTDKIVAAYASSVTGDIIDERTITLEADANTANLAAEISVEATTANVGLRTPVSTARVGTTDYAAWWGSANSGTIYYSTKSGGTWAARTAFATGITKLIEIVPIGAGLAVVYQSGTDVIFDWIVAPTVATPTSFPFARFNLLRNNTLLRR
jgi:hypothetical protein